jgi:hypothetical protein
LFGQWLESDERSNVAVQQWLVELGIADVARAYIDDCRAPRRRQQLKEFVVSHRSDLVQPVERMQRAHRQIGLGSFDEHRKFDL